MQDVMTPEQYEMLLQLGGDNQELQDAIAMQKAQAERLRASGEMPQGGMAGRVYVAPSVLQYAGSMANNKLAGDAEQGMYSKQKQVGQNMTQQNSAIMRAILGGGNPPAPAAAPTDPYSRFRMGGAV